MHRTSPDVETNPWTDVRTVYAPRLVEIRPVLGGPETIGVLFSWARSRHGPDGWYGYVVHSDGKKAEHVPALFLKPYEPD